MKNLARGSVFLVSLFALIVSLFYAQPQVEAVTTSISADPSNSQINLVEQEQQNEKRVAKTTAAEENNNNLSNETNNTIEDKMASSATKANARGFNATAYCLKGRTATGGSVRRGIVAADPRVLPLGTRIFVNAGSYSGNYTVADTGGAVRGRKLDIWVPNCSEAVRFGRRSISVSILAKN